MRTFVSGFIGFAAGVIATSVVLAPPAKDPPIHRVDYKTGERQLEVPLDSAGLPHGEMRMYHPSGRLKSISHYVHGQVGKKPTYEDHVADDAPVIDGDDRHSLPEQTE